MTTVAKFGAENGKKILSFAATMLAYNVIPFSVPTATVKLKNNSKAIKVIPPRSDPITMPVSVSGQSVGHFMHRELPKDRVNPA